MNVIVRWFLHTATFELDLDAEINVTIDKDVQDDINKITLIKSRTFTFPTYTPSIPSNHEHSQRKYKLKNKNNSEFVEYQGAYIRKTTALYLLQENAQLSNDRLLRVREEQPNHLLNRENVRNVVETFVKIGDTCIFKRLDTEKYLTGKFVQFSHLMGNKHERQYSSNYIDMSKDSFKSIGTFVNWVMARSGANDFVTFQRLDGIFTIGYILLEKFICKIDETLLNKSCISSTVLDEILSHWRISFTYDAEFVPQK